MAALQKSATYLLILLLTATPLANGAVDCDAQPARDAASPMVMPVAHDAQAVPEAADIEHHSHDGPALHQQSGNMNDSTSMDCCDDCLVMCTVAGGISVACTSATLDIAINGHDRLSAAAIDPRQDPHSRSLFRPPIPYI